MPVDPKAPPAIDVALAVRKGQLKLSDVPLAQRADVQKALRDEKALLTRARASVPVRKHALHSRALRSVGQ